MSHDYHEGLPGYHPAHVLHDGCHECEARAAAADHGIANLDTDTFLRAWRRAFELNLRHFVFDIADAETPLLNCLCSVQVQFERLGIPLGALPAVAS